MRPRHALIALTALPLFAAGCAAQRSTLPVTSAEHSGSVRSTTRTHPRQYAFTKYTIPTANSLPDGIVTGPDSALWFAEEAAAASKIGRLTTGGTFTEFQLAAGSKPSHVASAYGNVWFTSSAANDVGYVTPSGQITTYPASSTTRGVIEGAGYGRVWFTEFEAGSIAIVDAGTGVITEFPVPTPSSLPYDVAFGSDESTLWFTETGARKIGRITGKGAFKQYTTPYVPKGLAFGPDGAFWFTEPAGWRIGRMTTSGKVTTYKTPTTNSGPDIITVGSDGALWFTEFTASKIGRIAVDGTITEIATPDAHAQPAGITTGPDGNIWFVEHAANAIVELTP
jgi:virginiamycin B lyase